MPQVDPELFDRGQFQAELALKSSPIAAFKKAIRQFREVLDNRFNSGRDIRRLIEDRAWCVDQILQQAWQRFDWGDDADIALVAGRLRPRRTPPLRRRPADPPRQRGPGELPRTDRRLPHPALGHRPGSRPERALGAAVRGGSTRRPDGDHHLMECRTICGPDSLRQRMLQVGSAHMWPSKEFFLAKRHEQQRRHAKYNDTEYNLEPNVRAPRRPARHPDHPLDGPPPVRQPQPARPGARRLPGGKRVQHAGSSQEFLWRVRYARTCSPGAPRIACCSITSAASPVCSATKTTTSSWRSNASCRSTTGW